MADNTRLELRIDAKDNTGPASESTKRRFESIEQSAARMGAQASRSGDQARDSMGRFAAGTKAAGEAAVASGVAFEKASAGVNRYARSLDALAAKAALAGKTGVERLTTQRNIQISRLGDDEASIQRVVGSYDRIIRVQRAADAARRTSELRDRAVAASREPSAGAIAFERGLARAQEASANVREVERRALVARSSPAQRLGLEEQDFIRQYGTSQANISRIQSAFATIRKESNFTAQSLKEFGNEADAAGGRLLLVSLPLALGAEKALQLAANLEQARVSFKTLLGSQQASDRFVNTLQTFATTTPFNFANLVENSRFLLASGFKEQQIIPTLTAFGNAVAAGGGDNETLSRVLLQVGQIKSTGRATLEDLKPIAQAGVPIFDILTNAVIKPGQTYEQGQEAVRKALEKGGVFKAGPTLDLIQAELQKRYAGSLEEQNKTLRGQFSNLQDIGGLALTAIGDFMAPTVKSYVEAGNKILIKTREIVTGLQSLAPATKDFITGLGAIAITAPGAFIAIGGLAQAASFAVEGFSKIGTFFLKLPVQIQLALVAITAITEGWRAYSSEISDLKALQSQDKFTAGLRDLIGLSSSTTTAFGTFGTAASLATVPIDLVSQAVGRLLEKLGQISNNTGVTSAIEGLPDYIWERIKNPLLIPATAARNVAALLGGPESTVLDQGARDNLARLGPGSDAATKVAAERAAAEGQIGAARARLNFDAAKDRTKQQAAALREAESELVRARRTGLTEQLKDLAKEPAPGDLATEENYRARAALAVAGVNETINQKIKSEKEQENLTPAVRQKLEQARQQESENALAELARKQKDLDEKHYRENLDRDVKAGEEIRKHRLDLDKELFEQTRKAQDSLQTRQFEIDQQAAEHDRDLRLQGLEASQAQTLTQKLAVEDAKLAIEQDYAGRSLAIQIKKLEIERQTELGDAQRRAFRGFEPVIGPDGKPIKGATGAAIYDEALGATQEAVNQSFDQQIQAAQQAAGDKELIQARQTQNEKAKLVIDANRKVFDNLKSSANSLFDALFSKTQSFGDALKNVFKTAVLTPIKDILSSQTAAFFTRILTGKSVTFDRGDTASGPIGRLGGFLNRLGLGPPRIGGPGNTIADVQLRNGSVPVFITNGEGGGSQPRKTIDVRHTVSGGSGGSLGSLGALGGLAAGAAGLGGLIGGGSRNGTFSRILFGGQDITGGAGGGLFGGVDANSPFIFHYGAGGTPILDQSIGVPGFGGVSPVISEAGGAGGVAQGGGILSRLGLGNPLGALRSLGNIGYGPKGGDFGGEVAGSYRGVGGLAGGALLAGGAALALDGFRRGGLAGLGELTAGGAAIGAKFGGPLGALIGGGIGLGVGLVKLFLKSPEDKAREKIKAAYGLDVKEKSILKQIVGIAKQSYGGDIDTAIRSPQVRDLLQLYAQNTGQDFAIQNKVRAASLSQTAGGLVQNLQYENGRGLAFSGLAARTSADIIPTNTGGVGAATNYNAAGVTSINLTLNTKQTLDVFNGQTVNTIASNPRVVQAASGNALSGNYGRRDTASLLLQPGVLTS